MLQRIKTICTDKKLKQGQLRAPPGFCFQKGLRAGFAAGIRKGIAQGQPPVQAQAPQPPAQAPIPNLFGAIPTLPRRPRPRTNAPRRRPIQAQPVPSLKNLFNTYKVGKAKPRLRDMLLGLRFVNPVYRITNVQKRAMTPNQLKAWVIRSGEYMA